jgi:hypothetical protein
MARLLAVIVTLGVAAGCRDADHGPLDRQSRKAVEDVVARRDDVATGREAVADERQDVARARTTGKPPAKVAKEAGEVAQTTGELAADQAKLMTARDEFLRSSQIQLDELARRVDQAEARWGAAGKDPISSLRKDLAQLARIRARVVDDPQVDWHEEQQQFVTQVNTVEENLKALK